MWRACGLPLLGPRLRPVPGILRLGACSLEPLIAIRGPKRSHPLLMILSSAAMVSSWPGDACPTSIVNFLVKEDHIFFCKVLSEKIDSISYFLPVILVFTDARWLTRR